MIEKSQEMADRRANRRYRAGDGSYAALSPNSSKVGPIVDISMDGLCFRYIVHGDQPREPVETHIYVGDNGFYLDKMPYETVEDVEIDNPSSLATLIMRQRRIQFVGLTDNQKAQLKYFIAYRTSSQKED